MQETRTVALESTEFIIAQSLWQQLKKRQAKGKEALQQEGFGEVVETFNFATKAMGVKTNSIPASQEQAQHDQAKCSSCYLYNPRTSDFHHQIYIHNNLFQQSSGEKQPSIRQKNKSACQTKRKKQKQKIAECFFNGMGKKKLQVNNIVTTLQCKAIQP